MLAVVIPYFNPFGETLREKNTMEFLKHFQDFKDVHGVIVEVSHNKTWLPFSHQDKPANVIAHVRLPVSSIFWRRENMVNLIARTVLSERYNCFAWLDSDLVFTDVRWAKHTLKMLETVDIVQPFSVVELLDQDLHVTDTVSSFAKGWQRNYETRPDRLLPGHTGFAWAMRMDAFQKINGLEEYALVGGADMELACALIDKMDLVQRDKSPKQWEVVEKWGWAVHHNKLTMGYVPGLIGHMWHGDESKRGYTTRAQILKDANYDPVQDVTWKNGLLEFTDVGMRLQQPIADYFRSRIA